MSTNWVLFSKAGAFLSNDFLSLVKKPLGYTRTTQFVDFCEIQILGAYKLNGTQISKQDNWIGFLASD